MSAVPAVLDALVAMFKTAAPGAQVEDGPPTRDIRGDLIGVGLAPQEGDNVETVEEPAGLKAVRETFTVICVARSWSGGDSVKAQRDRTYRLVTAVKAALKADRTLGGVALDARFSGSSYMPWRHDQGFLVVDVTFRVAATVLA